MWFLHARLAQRSGFEISADILEQKRASATSAEARDLNKLALHSLAHLPSEWRGKRYRRTAGLGSEHARAEGERAERLRKGKEVVGILLEANLPYATSCQATPRDEAALLRCCRGLRAALLLSAHSHALFVRLAQRRHRDQLADGLAAEPRGPRARRA